MGNLLNVCCYDQTEENTYYEHNSYFNIRKNKLEIAFESLHDAKKLIKDVEIAENYWS